MRLFVALNLPPPIRQALWEATAPLRELELPLRWAHAEGIHLTLKFLGEVAEGREGELAAALGRAARGARAVTLTFGGFGVFPDFARPRVVWVGVASEPALELLQHQVEREFASLGFETEARPFRPHVTLARATRDARPRALAGLEASLARLAYDATTTVGAVDLVQSTLQSAGTVYQVRHSERLL